MDFRGRIIKEAIQKIENGESAKEIASWIFERGFEQGYRWGVSDGPYNKLKEEIK